MPGASILSPASEQLGSPACLRSLPGLPDSKAAAARSGLVGSLLCSGSRRRGSHDHDERINASRVLAAVAASAAAASGGGSSINWFTSGLSLANGLVVTLDTNRQIKVFCGGGGSTDFLIDVLGYYF
jgi:hypothetical protein